MRRTLSTACLLSVCTSITLAHYAHAGPQTPAPEGGTVTHQAPPFSGTRPSVDLAILLDTSNSMDGLIGQAKQQLWTIVNQFAAAQKEGKTPRLRVALFEYGNSGLPASESYIRQVTGLTDDLDEISARLFALQTDGGDEYCGQVIHEATRRLDWSETPNAYKTIFIAGNEPFHQGPMAYPKACRRAIEKGIIVNTIHCGDYNAGVEGDWHKGAQLAEGDFLNINQDEALVHIDAPQDEAILELNVELNRTYIWYGAKAGYFSQNQIEQDQNAHGLSRSAVVQRARTKASKMYSNFGRDLVDTYQEQPGLLAKIKPEALPKPLQTFSRDELIQHIEQLRHQRTQIQEKIQALQLERDT